MKKWIFSILMLQGTFTAFAQTIYSPSQLQQDFSIMQAALREAHPGLYRYNSKEKIDSGLRRLRRQLNKGMTELEFYRLANSFLATIGDGHMKFHRKDQVDVHDAFFDEGYFPLRLYFRNNKAYVRSSYLPTQTLQPSTEIISINGEPVGKIIKVLFENIFSDGKVVSSKYEELDHFFAGYYATFIGPARKFTVGYLTAQGRKGTITLPSINKNKIKNEPPSNDTFSITYPAEGIALLRIPVFEDGEKQSYTDFIANAFKEIKAKKINALIIDLRNNEGGTDAFGFELYSYLTTKPFRYYDHFTVATNKPYSFSAYAQFPPGIDSLKKTLVKVNNEYHFIYKDGLGMLQPKPGAFTGKVYILQNGYSFSVTSEFCSIAKDNNRAITIGDENGGTFQGNNSGAFALVQLPNTKIGLDIPLLGYYMHLQHQHPKATGIPADYRVIPTIEDVLQKKDIVLEQAFRLAKNGGKGK